MKANFGRLNEKELTRSDEQRGISSMNQFDFHRFKYFPGLGRNYSWAGLHGTLPALPVLNSTSSFCSKYRGFFKSGRTMTMIIIVMMIRMLMMGAIIAGRDCIVLPPSLVLYNACVANIGVGAFL